jgi:hypothetical protein
LTDFWHLINPKLDDGISVETAITFIEDLMFISVDLMLNYFKNNMPHQDPLQQGLLTKSQNKAYNTSHESKQEEMNRQCAIRYLMEAKKQKDNVLENIKDMLKFMTTVRRQDLEPIVRKEFSKTYNVRILLTKNFNPAFEPEIEIDKGEINELRSIFSKSSKSKT